MAFHTDYDDDFSLPSSKVNGGGGGSRKKINDKKKKKQNKSEVSIYNSKHVRKLEALMEKKQLNNKST